MAATGADKAEGHNKDPLAEPSDATVLQVSSDPSPATRDIKQTPNPLRGSRHFATASGLLKTTLPLPHLDGPNLENVMVWAIQGRSSNSIMPLHQLVAKFVHCLSQHQQILLLGLFLKL